MHFARGMANLDRSDIRHVLAVRREALIARWRRDIERECERRGLGASGWRALARPHRDADDFSAHFGRIAGTKARELGEIIAAMRRLEHGRYGICVYCGSAIDDERLAALPETRRCESCVEPEDDEEEAPCAPL
jgi:RNA polymerase-binding transcription factor DksA